MVDGDGSSPSGHTKSITCRRLTSSLEDKCPISIIPSQTWRCGESYELMSLGVSEWLRFPGGQEVRDTQGAAWQRREVREGRRKLRTEVTKWAGRFRVSSCESKGLSDLHPGVPPPPLAPRDAPQFPSEFRRCVPETNLSRGSKYRGSIITLTVSPAIDNLGHGGSARRFSAEIYFGSKSALVPFDSFSFRGMGPVVWSIGSIPSQQGLEVLCQPTD
jgi:hypothetical protein